MWLMTIPAYTSLWELLYPSINPYAWGYDFWYDGYARDKDKSSRGREGEEEGRGGREVRRHKMGIMSGMIVIHQQSRSSNSSSSSRDKYPHLQKKNSNNDNGRTDNAGDTAASNIHTYIHSFSCICRICVSSHKC